MIDTAFASTVLLSGFALIGAIGANALGARIRLPAPAIVLVAAAATSDWFPALERIPLVVDERVVTICLIVILFDGGMQIGWKHFRAAAGSITLVGTAGTAATAAAITLIARFLLDLDWGSALLLGAALSPTDPAVVFAVLGRREIEGPAGTLLEGESGVNDPVGIALLGTLLTAAGSVAGVATAFLVQMAVGAGVGIMGGLGLRLLSRRVRLPEASLYPLRPLGVAALVFAGATLLHGSGFLAVLIAGVLVGDERAPYSADVRRFTGGLSSLAEIVAFTVLGLSVSMTGVLRPDVLLPGLALAGLLIVAVRPLVVGPLLLPLRLAWGERAFVLFAGLRGAVPILLGLAVRQADVPGADRIVGIIFIVVLVSVLVQGSLVPTAAALFHVPMRQVEQQPFAAGLRFRTPPDGLQHHIVAAGSPADGTAIEALTASGGVWVSLVRRAGTSVPLHPGTVLRAGDEVLLHGRADQSGIFGED